MMFTLDPAHIDWTPTLWLIWAAMLIPAWVALIALDAGEGVVVMGLLWPLILAVIIGAGLWVLPGAIRKEMIAAARARHSSA